MLVGAGLSRIWPHDRAHYFFARAVWSPDQVGLTLARLVVKNTTSASRLYLARCMIEMLADGLPGRTVHGVGDAAYSGKDLKGLSEKITWTTRLRKDAALYAPAPPRTGRRGRPKLKGDRLPALAILATRARFTPAAVTRYGKTTTVQTATIRCLWYSVFGPATVQVILIRDKTTSGGYDLALVSTDTTASAAQVIERYAAR